MGVVGSGALFGVDGGLAEVVEEDGRGAVYVGAAEFYLLNAFTLLGQESGDGAAGSRMAGGEDVEGDAACEVEFKFGGVLFGRNVGEMREVVGSANEGEGVLANGEADRYRWR